MVTGRHYTALFPAAYAAGHAISVNITVTYYRLTCRWQNFCGMRNILVLPAINAARGVNMTHPTLLMRAPM